MTGIGDFLFHSRPLWGIDGPTWLLLMGVGLGVGFVLWLIADIAGKVRAHKGIREATERPQGWAVHTAASMPPQHAAYLCGGRRRVTDLAFAELEMAGALTTQEHTNERSGCPPRSPRAPVRGRRESRARRRDSARRRRRCSREHDRTG